jgi:hypothetical protein
MPFLPKMTLKEKRYRVIARRLRRKIERLYVRELIDRDPDFRATAKELVELCNFPRACGNPACARAQTCAQNLECYVVAHHAFGKALPIMQESLARRNVRV